jgi:hypothetical protein
MRCDVYICNADKKAIASMRRGTARNLRLLKWRPSQEKMARVTLVN